VLLPDPAQDCLHRFLVVKVFVHANSFRPGGKLSATKSLTYQLHGERLRVSVELR
jgi:hypothetical protein